MRLALYLRYYQSVYANGNMIFDDMSLNAYTIQYFYYLEFKAWRVEQILASALRLLNESI